MSVQLIKKYKLFLIAFFSVLAFLLMTMPAMNGNPVREYKKYYIQKQNGELVTIYLEESRTREERDLGLMYRESLPKNHGMIFLLEHPEHVSFWMKNTFIGLDIIMLDQDGKIIEIFQRVQPQTTNNISSKGMTQYVIELGAGQAEELGIREGDMLVNP